MIVYSAHLNPEWFLFADEQKKWIFTDERVKFYWYSNDLFKQNVHKNKQDDTKTRYLIWFDPFS